MREPEDNVPDNGFKLDERLRFSLPDVHRGNVRGLPGRWDETYRRVQG